MSLIAYVLFVVDHEDDCFICGDGGELVMCDRGGCAKCYHLECLTIEEKPRGKWMCPWHFCDECGKRAAMLCSECPNSFCREHTEGQITKVGPGLYNCGEHILTQNKVPSSAIQDQPPTTKSKPLQSEIGRASCRERV